MKLLISLEELKNYKSRDKIPIECEVCHNTFYTQKNNVQWAFKRKSVNYLRVCSKNCRNILNDFRITTKCDQCNKEIKKQRSHIKKFKKLFCSNSCKGIYWNAHKNWGCGRSKLEKWLEIQLKTTYPNLIIKYNDRETLLRAELDIYIPSLKLAFELNGIFHYEPVFGDNLLEKTIGKDQRKFQLCIRNNISLCVIDTSHQKYFKENTSKKFLDIITKIINEKMAENTGADPDSV